MEPFLGQIQVFGFNFAPRGWAKCEGQILSIPANTALFSLLGTMYGGDGRSTFGLPDLRSRSIVGMGQGPGLSNIDCGDKGGVEAIYLQTNNLPAHNHNVSVNVNNNTGTETDPKYIISAHAGFSDEVTAGAQLGGVYQNNVGGNIPFNNRNPFLGMNFCIALEGLFPQRI